MLIPQPLRDTAVAALAGLDPLDVLAAIGALQLLPENANALFRLEAAAGVASTVAPVGAGTAIPDEAAVAWVNRPVARAHLSGDALLGGAEDEITSELGGDQSAISWRVEECVRATKGDGVAFPGEADCIEVELADRLVRGCYLVGKAVAVN